MEGGGLAGVCQEETSGTSQSEREADRQKKGEFRRRQFLLPLPPPAFSGETYPTEASRHTEPVPDLSCTNGLSFPLFSLSLSLFFGIISLLILWPGDELTSSSGFTALTGMQG